MSQPGMGASWAVKEAKGPGGAVRHRGLQTGSKAGTNVSDGRGDSSRSGFSVTLASQPGRDAQACIRLEGGWPEDVDISLDGQPVGDNLLCGAYGIGCSDSILRAGGGNKAVLRGRPAFMFSPRRAGLFVWIQGETAAMPALDASGVRQDASDRQVDGLLRSWGYSSRRKRGQ